MFIAHVRFSVPAARRQAAIKVLVDESANVRTMPGCIAFVPFLDGASSDGLGVLHEWESEEAFRAYAESAAFANSGRLLRPMMTAAPISKRFDASLMESVN